MVPKLAMKKNCTESGLHNRRCFCTIIKWLEDWQKDRCEIARFTVLHLSASIIKLGTCARTKTDANPRRKILAIGSRLSLAIVDAAG